MRAHVSLFFYCFFFGGGAAPLSMWDLSSPTRDQTWALGSDSAVLILDHQGNPSILFKGSLGFYHMDMI